MIFNLGKIHNEINMVPSYGFYRPGVAPVAKMLGWHNPPRAGWHKGHVYKRTQRCCHLAIARLNRAIYNERLEYVSNLR